MLDRTTGPVRLAIPLSCLSATLIVLLLTGANIAHLQLARAMARSREIRTRMALGAGRARVARQLLTEALLLSLVAGRARHGDGVRAARYADGGGRDADARGLDARRQGFCVLRWRLPRDVDCVQSGCRRCGRRASAWRTGAAGGHAGWADAFQPGAAAMQIALSRRSWSVPACSAARSHARPPVTSAMRSRASRPRRSCRPAPGRTPLHKFRCSDRRSSRRHCSRLCRKRRCGAAAFSSFDAAQVAGRVIVRATLGASRSCGCRRRPSR